MQVISESVSVPVQGRMKLATVDIAIPVLNEERALSGCVRTLHAFLSASFPLPWQVTIVDNGSTDETWPIAQRLAAELDGVTARRLDVRGKGAAVRAAWCESEADIVAYMDVDLSTDLGALLPLIAPLASGHSSVAIGTRLAGGSQTSRGFKREALSRGYNGLLKHVFQARFSDAACGFKAARASVARELLSKVEDDGWFFDTELLLIAEHNGLRVHEVPVDWIEDLDSKVKVGATVRHNLRGLVRTTRRISAGETDVALPPRPRPAPAHPDAVVRTPRSSTLLKLTAFVLIGIASTVAHAGIYLLLRSWWAPELANLAALTLTGLANTEANRRWTFASKDARRVRAHFRAGSLFLLNYCVTSGAVLALAPAADPHAETVALLLASAVVTLLRYIALDRWVFPVRRPA
ncbi:glycosyltransferase [Actinocorallia lasiicapitis]